MKRTEWSGYFDKNGKMICENDILIDEKTDEHYICRKIDGVWVLDVVDRVAAYVMTKWSAAMCTIIAFEQEEE